MEVQRACLTMHVLLVWMATSVSAKDTAEQSPDLQQNGTADAVAGSNFASLRDDQDPCTPPQRIVKGYTTCGEGYCRCTDTMADCSNHPLKLTYVPKLPSNISHLTFTLNALFVIEREDFFVNVSDIIVLDIAGNMLSHIADGVFRPLHNLKVLKLGFNFLRNYSAIASALSVPTLQVLDLTENPLGPPPSGIFQTYPLPQLETLCLNANGLLFLHMEVFQPLSSLRNLQLLRNHLSQKTLQTDYLPQLTALILMGNSFSTYLDTCRNGESLFPNLTMLDISFNPIYQPTIPPVCLPKLQLLSLQNAFLSVIFEDSFNTSFFPSLMIVVLDGNNRIDTIEKNAFRNRNLRLVSLKVNAVNFGAESISEDTFAGCPLLQRLDLNGNDFSDVSEEKFQRLFGQVPALAVLNMTSTQLGHISAGMWKDLSNLTALSLYANRLTSIPDGVFDALTQLTAVDLSKNKITTVREETFSEATRQRLKHLDLSGNPFVCSCELKWFKQWLTSHPALFRDPPFGHPWNNYTCSNLPNTTVQSFYVADQACLWSPTVSKFIIASIILLMLPMGLLSVLYRYRWHIRLMLSEAGRGRRERWRRLQEQHFRYDIFVSFDSEDLSWVRTHLIPEVEERLRLRLCIHQRDFTPGVPIVQNIEESVQASKKVMMLFSKNFAESPWCQFELHLSLSHVLENDDALVVVLLEDVPSRYLTPAMMAVMKTTTYIEWGDEPEARASFWGRLRLSLNEILPTM